MEKPIHYTHCVNSQGATCSSVIAEKAADQKDCKCTGEKNDKFTFNLTEAWTGDVFIYYELENFYQNHRRYVKSRKDEQLLGKINNNVNDDCIPFQKCTNAADCKNGINITLPVGTPYLPCGAIANSLFSGKLFITL